MALGNRPPSLRGRHYRGSLVLVSRPPVYTNWDASGASMRPTGEGTDRHRLVGTKTNKTGLLLGTFLIYEHRFLIRDPCVDCEFDILPAQFRTWLKAHGKASEENVCRP